MRSAAKLCTSALAALVVLGGASASHAAAPAEAPPKGAAIVAVGEDATTPAKPLVRALYADAEVNPGIDDATARILVGEAVGDSATPKQKELADLRASIARAGSDAAERRLLASIGEELHAVLVVEVRTVAGKPSARVLRVTGATFSSADLVATVAQNDPGEASYAWPSAATTVRGLLGPIAPKAATPPARPELLEVKTGFTSKALTSSWFWAGLGALATLAVTVVVVAKVSDGGSTSSVHATGTVPP